MQLHTLFLHFYFLSLYSIDSVLVPQKSRKKKTIQQSLIVIVATNTQAIVMPQNVHIFSTHIINKQLSYTSFDYFQSKMKFHCNVLSVFVALHCVVHDLFK